MAVLVTGGAGFIGSHFIEHLLAREDSRVVCLDNFNDYYDVALKRRNVGSFSSDQRVTVVEADICDAVAMRSLFEQQQIEAVVHLAAYAGVRYSIHHPLIFQQANVQGTLSLLEAARQCPVRRFVLVSSSTVYGKDAVAPFVEDAPLGIPLSPYGATKRAAEVLALTYWQLHSLPVVCLRPFSVYGTRLRPDLALSIFCNAIVSASPIPLFGDGTIRRDFTHVSDICDGLLAALRNEAVAGETINLGHAESIAIRDVISLLQRELGMKALIQQLPEVPGEMPITKADLRKAARLLDYRPRVEFADGVREYVRWFLAERQSRAGA